MKPLIKTIVSGELNHRGNTPIYPVTSIEAVVGLKELLDKQAKEIEDLKNQLKEKESKKKKEVKEEVKETK